MLVQPGDRFEPDRLDRSLKTLYATGLFEDVQLSRSGDTLVVHVVENPIVNRVAFEGNHKLSDDQLRTELQLRPRAVFTPALAEADRQRILDLYAKKGYYDATVDPKIIHQDQNRVDVVFQINDGSATLISKIVINGNKAFSEDRLTEVINSRESRWWRFLSSSDQYDPERLAYDRELLRRFYLKNGYADIQIVDASAAERQHPRHIRDRRADRHNANRGGRDVAQQNAQNDETETALEQNRGEIPRRPTRGPPCQVHSGRLIVPLYH